MRSLSIALALLVLAGSLASASPVAGPITNPANGHEYYLLAASTWTAAEAEAVSLGGHLITINDAAEDAWLSTTEPVGFRLNHRWIGLTDASDEGNWVWVNGEPVTYTRWLPGEPNNLGGIENYGEWAQIGWNDVANDGWGVAHQGIVEVIPAGPTLLTVCWDGNGDYLTIQEGIDAASDGDQVVLCIGTYTGDGNRDLDFGGKAITVRSTNPSDPAVVATTVIDCQGSSSSRHRGFNFHSGEAPDSVLAGLTIKNGYAPLESTGSETTSAGGGIFCTGSGGYYGSPGQGSKPTIRNCIIEDNHADRYGGGMFFQYWSTATIANCIIRDNQTSSGNLNFGGGIYTWRRNALTITSCLFAGNLAGGNGGGLHYYDESPVTVVNCTFVGNTAGNSGGGIDCSWNTTDATVENCILWGNTSPQIVANAAQWYATVSYSDVQGGFSGAGNIDADPLFDLDGIHLLNGSPCINTGDPLFVFTPGDTDIDGENRVQQCRVDIGADETSIFTPIACDDSGVCTADSCDALMVCVHDGTGVFISCDDGNACTSGDVCQGDAAGTCAGTDTSAVDCDDSNICTNDTCDTVLGCLNDGAGVAISCDDGDVCTTGDVCQGDIAGTCRGTDTSATDCDDEIACTTDTCDPSTGCDHAPVDAACDDGSICTTDSCDMVLGCVNTAPGACTPPTVGDDVCNGGPNDGGSCSTDADCPGGVCGTKSRYATITPSVVVSRAVAGTRSIQVTIASMPLDPARVGEVWWAGSSQSINNAPNPALNGAQVLCESTPSNAEVWPVGSLHLFGEPIVSGASYEVRMCDATGSACSDPRLVVTGKWGDIVPPFGGGTQPDFLDISAAVAKFQANVSAPDMPRTDLVGSSASGAPNTPNQDTNFADINADIGAFKSQGYPFTVPACP